MGKQYWLWLWCGLLICMVLLLDFSITHARIIERDIWSREALDAENESAPLCRFGVNFGPYPGERGQLANYDLTPLRPGWYIDYTARSAPARPNGIEFAQMIHLTQTSTDTYTYSPGRSSLETIIANQPGSDFMIANEPDRILYQDDIEPHIYADAYHELYHLIKSLDPTARIFAGSIVQPTPIRLAYLDKVLERYEAVHDQLMPVDGWNIHNFILNEASCEYYNDLSICWGADIPPGIDATDGLRVEVDDNDNFDLFKEQIQRFRVWLTDKGYQDVPVYLSEYGVLMPESYGFPSSRVNAFMNKTFDYLLNTKDREHGDPNDDYRLIQRLSWYSVNDDRQYNGYLFDSTTFERSPMGDNYASYTSQVDDSAMPYLVQLTTETIAQRNQNDDNAVLLKAQIANSGHGLAEEPFTVRFYSGKPFIEELQIGDAQTVMLSGCGDNQIVEMEWNNLNRQGSQIYVRIEGNGRTSIFPNEQIFFPLVRSHEQSSPNNNP